MSQAPFITPRKAQEADVLRRALVFQLQGSWVFSRSQGEYRSPNSVLCAHFIVRWQPASLLCPVRYTGGLASYSLTPAITDKQEDKETRSVTLNWSPCAIFMTWHKTMSVVAWSSFISERYLKRHIFGSHDHSDETVFTRVGDRFACGP